MVFVFTCLQEGIDYLKSEGKTKLLEYQGLAEPEASKPGLPRDNTMAVTAKVTVLLTFEACLCQMRQVEVLSIFSHCQLGIPYKNENTQQQQKLKK